MKRVKQLSGSAQSAHLSGNILALLLTFTTLLAGCAVNPVTGQREVVLMSPEREAAVGKQVAAEVERNIGLLRSPAFEQYVNAVGQRLARYSPRQDVTYRFFIANMEEPNAFALPGGYVYVSRGLLTITNSEAELANVIGHEIGHVAARHSAQRETRALGVGVLSVLGSIAAGALGGAEAAKSVSQFGQVAGAGLIASYSRDQERQSDEIGQKLAAQAGWDPAAMTRFLSTLERQSELSEAGPRRPSFFDSHPITTERVRTTAARAKTLHVVPSPPITRSRADFFARLDNLLIGPDPAEGVFRDNLFLHPTLGFAMAFPRGWKTQNQKVAVKAASPKRDAMVVLEGQGRAGDPHVAAQRFAQQNGLQLQDGHSLRIGDLPAYGAVAEAQTQQGTLGVHLTWVAHPSGMFRITGATSVSRFRQYARVFRSAAESFRSITGRERNSIRELRLRVVKARAGESLALLAKRTGNRWNIKETALANGLSTNVKLTGGEAVKIAVEVPFRP